MIACTRSQEDEEDSVCATAGPSESLIFDASDVRFLLQNGSTRLVDKTDFMLKILMMENTKKFILARPRKFGVSTFLQTLALICEGEQSRPLFKGKAIYEAQDYKWPAYKVVYLDFSKIYSASKPLQFEQDLQSELKTIGGVAREANIETQTTKLIEALSQGENNKIVVLVDGYDYPIMSALLRTNLNPQLRYNVSDMNRLVMKRFFSALNEVESKLRLVFVTGVIKFAEGLVIPNTDDSYYDLSNNEEFNAIVGFTRTDLYTYFDDLIVQIADRQSTTKGVVRQELAKFFEGYKFAHTAPAKIYNPYAVLSCLERGGELDHYWYPTAPSQHSFRGLTDPRRRGGPIFAETRINRGELDGIRAINDTSVDALMYYEGLYTINEYDHNIGKYILLVPNDEIRCSLTAALNEKNLRLRLRQPTYVRAWRILDEISARNAEENVRVLVGMIDSQSQREPGRTKMRRPDYEDMIRCILTEAGLFNIVRRPTNVTTSQISLQVETYQTLVLIQLALNRSISTLVENLEANDHLRVQCQKKCLYLALNFSKASEGFYPIHDYHWRLYDRFAPKEEFLEGNVSTRVKITRTVRRKIAFQTNDTRGGANSTFRPGNTKSKRKMKKFSRAKVTSHRQSEEK